MSEETTLSEFAEQQQDGSTGGEELREDGFLTLPCDWKVSTLDEVAKEGGLVDGDWIESADMDEDGEIQLVQLGHIGQGQFKGEPNRFITGDFAEKEDCTVLSEGDLLISRMQEPILRSCLLPSFDRDSVMAVDIARLQETEDWNRQFLKYILNSRPIWKQGIAWASGTTRKRISRKNMEKLRLPTPSLSEQRKIATVLYTVDRAIEKTSELIEQLGRVKQGVRQNILTSGITEDGKVRASPESEPEQYTDARQWTVPNSWELKELSDICSIQVGYAFKSDWYQEEGNVRVLRGANVGYGEPDWSETYFLEPERVSEYEEYLLNEGDLIIGMDRPYTNSGFKISRLSETDVPSLLVQRVGRFVPEGCDPDYLHVVLSDWRYQKQVLRRAQGMDIPHISQTDILSPKIPLPPLDEQKRIADRYSSILERISCEENLLREYKTLKQGLMQDLLSGTIRTTDTNIEVPEEVAQYG